jgi:hypothetical protein
MAILTQYDEYFYVNGDEELFDSFLDAEKHRSEMFGTVVLGDEERRAKKLPEIRSIGIRHCGGDSVAPLEMIAKYVREKT